jgi:capsular polysaccharide biosynthesis protein/Mrp family chromosome partitioning ATPase
LTNHKIKEKTLRDLLSVLFRHKLVIISIFAIIMTTVYISNELRTPLYVAEVKMLLSRSTPRDLRVEGETNTKDFGFGSPIDTVIEMVQAKPVVERVVKALRLDNRPLDFERPFASRLKRILIDASMKKIKREIDKMNPKDRQAYLFQRTVDQLSGQISAYRYGETSLFVIEVRDYDPNIVVILANSVSRSFVIFDLEQQIADLQLTYGEKYSSIQKLHQHIEKMEETLDGRTIPDLEAIGPAGVKIVGQARESNPVPMKPDKFSLLAIGFIMSIVSSIVISFGIEHLKQTFTSPRDVETYLDIPLLGSIPKQKGKRNGMLDENFSSDPVLIETYQSVSNHIYSSLKEKQLKSILMINMNATKNASSVGANIARNLNNNGEHKALIIDVNTRSLPGYQISGNDNAGLADVLNGRVSFEDAVQMLDSNLSVLLSGNTSSSSIPLFDPSAMNDLLEKVENVYDSVIVVCNADSNNTADVLALSSLADGVVIVLNEGESRRLIVKDLIIRLEKKKSNIIGVIFNNRRYPIPEMVYKLT